MKKKIKKEVKMQGQEPTDKQVEATKKKIIEALTPEQEAKLSHYRDKWIKIGLDTGRPDKRACNKAIKQTYVNGGLKPPKKIVWTRSPIEAIEKAKELVEYSYDHISNFCYGAHEASWLSFYDCCLELLGLEDCRILEPHMEVAKHCGWWLPFEDLAIVSEKPTVINFKDNVLHKDGGPAIKYRDGFCVYALNGIRVSKEIAETPASKLDAHLVLTEKNADIRREIVRKIGIERVIQQLGAKVIDKQGDYELLNLELGDGRIRPYLKMKNPSIGIYHIEGVPPNTKTVKEALVFRNGTDEEPVSLT